MSDGESPLGALTDTSVAVEPEVAPAPQTDTTAEPSAEQQPTGAEQTFEQPQEQPQEQRPQQNLGRDVARIVRELSESNPDKAALLKQMKEAYFRDASYKGHFESPELAQRARATFDAIGGEEGLQQLQDTAAAVRQIDEQAATGSPELIDAWLKESPEGLMKAAPYALQKIEQVNPQAFNKMVAPYFIKALWATGINDVVRNLEWYANQSNNDGLRREVSGMRQWLNQLSQTSQQFDQQASDPRAGEFREQQQQLAQREAQMQRREIGNAVQSDLESAVDASLKEHDRNGIFKGDARQGMISAIIYEIDRTLALDSGYQSTLSSLKQRGNIDEIAKFIMRNVNAVRGRAARDVWLSRAAPFQRQPMGGPAPTAAPAPQRTANGQRATTAQMVAAKPNASDIDWDKDPTRDHFIAGRAYLKNGSFVSWRKN